MAIIAPVPAMGQSGDVGSQQGMVAINVESFGVGNVVRPGSWMGVRLGLTDHGARVRDVLVRMERQDADGDIQSIQQVVALAPGATRGVWMYARLPFAASGAGVAYDVIVEPIDDNDGAPVSTGADPIGTARIAAAGEFGMADSIIAVVGRRSMSLEQYAVEYQPGGGISGTLHNLTRTISGLRPIDLPDSWMGLDQFDAIIWSDGDPSALLPSQIRAIEDWVRGGGRLIVVLSASSADWTNPRANPLIGITPETLVQRIDGSDLEPVRSLLMLESSQAPMPGRNDAVMPMPHDETLHVFRPLADSPDTVALLKDKRNRNVAVRRTVGCGEVTLVGIDLSSPGLAGLLDSEAFWHRVLGRRGDLFTMAEMDELRKSEDAVNFLHPEGVWLDQVIAGSINKIGRAGVGVLLGLIVFGVYLLLAGPVSFAVLGKLGKREHSWVVFLAMAGVFTAIAWGGATALRPANEDITHLTLLEHVYQQPTQRAKVWFSALLPTYGSQTVSIPIDPSARPTEYAALSNWDDPENFGQGNFPDSRAYAVDSRRPDTLRVPTRSTVKRFEAEWVGGPRWSMIRPDSDDPIRIDPNGKLLGSLSHQLPAALDRVTILLVRGQAPLTSRRLGGPLLANAWAHRLTDTWEPGQELDLGSLGTPSRAERYFEILASKERTSNLGVGGSATPDDRLEMLLWRDVIEPPSWSDSNTGQSFDKTLRTRSMHGWEGGRWMTQPCLIIVGMIDEAPSPVPIEIDGRTPPTIGKTVLRWVYPLGSKPPLIDQQQPLEETN